MEYCKIFLIKEFFKLKLCILNYGIWSPLDTCIFCVCVVRTHNVTSSLLIDFWVYTTVLLAIHIIIQQSLFILHNWNAVLVHWLISSHFPLLPALATVILLTAFMSSAFFRFFMQMSSHNICLCMHGLFHLA